MHAVAMMVKLRLAQVASGVLTGRLPVVILLPAGLSKN
jgi:hypothetical protein